MLGVICSLLRRPSVLLASYICVVLGGRKQLIMARPRPLQTHAYGESPGTSCHFLRASYVALWFLLGSAVLYRGYLVASWLHRNSTEEEKSDSSSREVRPPVKDDSGFPSFYATVCNVNPLKATSLLQVEPTSNLTGLDVYGMWADAQQGRLSQVPGFFNLSHAWRYFHLLDKYAPEARDSILDCELASHPCTWRNFSRSVILGGSCFTLKQPLPPGGHLKLTLDPQEFNYVLPNEGLVGYRVLAHSLEDLTPHKLAQALIVGPRFLNHLRLTWNSMTRHETNCQDWTMWNFCLRRCERSLVMKWCGCTLHRDEDDSCSLADLMKCGIPLEMLQERLRASVCPQCGQACSSVQAKIDSLTQVIQTSHFFSSNAELDSETVSSLPRNSSSSVQILDVGNQLQVWAALRESNFTLSQDLRRLARVHAHLFRSLQEVDAATSRMEITLGQWLEPTERLCPTSASQKRLMFDQGKKSAVELVTKLRNSFLFNTPTRNFSLLLVSLIASLEDRSELSLVHLILTKELAVKLQELSTALPFNDVIADVSMMMDLRPEISARNSQEECTPGAMGDHFLESTGRLVDLLKQNSFHLQEILTRAESEFKTLKDGLLKAYSDSGWFRRIFKPSGTSQVAIPSLDRLIRMKISIAPEGTKSGSQIVNTVRVQPLRVEMGDVAELAVSALTLLALFVLLLEILWDHYHFNSRTDEKGQQDSQPAKEHFCSTSSSANHHLLSQQISNNHAGNMSPLHATNKVTVRPDLVSNVNFLAFQGAANACGSNTEVDSFQPTRSPQQQQQQQQECFSGSPEANQECRSCCRQCGGSVGHHFSVTNTAQRPHWSGHQVPCFYSATTPRDRTRQQSDSTPKGETHLVFIPPPQPNPTSLLNPISNLSGTIPHRNNILYEPLLSSTSNLQLQSALVHLQPQSLATGCRLVSCASPSTTYFCAENEVDSPE